MSEENKMSVGEKTRGLGGGKGGERRRFEEIFHNEKKNENIRKHAALWMQSVANAELVFYYHNYYFTWQSCCQ